MKTKFLVLTLIASFALTGCLEGRDQAVNQDGSIRQKVDPTKAEQQVADGEVLINPVTFMYADKYFVAALKNDPGNTKAGLYHALLSPVMKMRGIFARARPYVESLGNGLV